MTLWNVSEQLYVNGFRTIFLGKANISDFRVKTQKKVSVLNDTEKLPITQNYKNWQYRHFDEFNYIVNLASLIFICWNICLMKIIILHLFFCNFWNSSRWWLMTWATYMFTYLDQSWSILCLDPTVYFLFRSPATKETA